MTKLRSRQVFFENFIKLVLKVKHKQNQGQWGMNLDVRVALRHGLYSVNTTLTLNRLALDMSTKGAELRQEIFT